MKTVLPLNAKIYHCLNIDSVGFMREFTWKVGKSLTREPQLNVRVVQFGNGYEQRQKTSLGRPLYNFSFSLKAKKETADDAFNFLMEHGGVEPFLWNGPDGTQYKVVCDDFKNDVFDGLNHTVSGTFREVKG